MSTPTKSKSSSDRESYWSVPIPISKSEPNRSQIRDPENDPEKNRCSQYWYRFLYISLSNHYSFIQFHALEWVNQPFQYFNKLLDV